MTEIVKDVPGGADPAGPAGQRGPGAYGDDRPGGADRLLARVEAVRRFLRAVDGHLPDDRLVTAHTVVERAGTRLALSRDHTLVALAGATGSGKSSLFNALARFEMSPVGVRRPTTGVTHACVWGPLDGATKLLDWVGVLPRNRFVRESPLDGDDEAALSGLILLDLPDFDSVRQAHRLEVDRMLGLVDLVVWVVDPQKYADRLVHTGYLRRLHQHQDVTVVVLNQADLLTPADVPRIVHDLRRLLDTDGLHHVPVLVTSALHQSTMANLRSTLEHTVAGRQAALRRLADDVDALAERLSAMFGPPVGADGIDRDTTRRLTDALAESAGVPAVAEASELAYQHRAVARIDWPLVRGLRRLRPDPLRRLHLPGPARDGIRGGPKDASIDSPVAVTSLPDPTAAQRAAVGLAVRAVGDRVAAPLPEPWPAAVTSAARSRRDDLTDALDRAIATTDLGLHRAPTWWRLVGAVQWMVTLIAVTGLGWLLAGYLIRVLGLPRLQHPMVGLVPVPTLMLLGGLAAGLLLAVLVKPVVSAAARRVRRRADDRLRAAVAEVGREHVLAPVHNVLHAYAQAREALAAMRSPR